MLHQPLGDREPEPAAAAGNDVGSRRVESEQLGRTHRYDAAFGHVDHDFADVLGLREVLQGARRLLDRKPHQRKALILVLENARRDLLEQRRDLGFLLSDPAVDVEARVAAVLSEETERDPPIFVNVGLADLDEAAEWREAPDALRERASRKRVQDDVDAFSAGYLEHRVAEVARARVEDVLDAQASKIFAFRFAARGRENPRAETARHLNRRQPDTAGCRVDQYALAGSNARQALECDPSGQEHRR